jgi:shikimate dehydrogenase
MSADANANAGAGLKVAGVMGWPVAHSKSPLIHRFWLHKLGIDGEYGRLPVHPDRLGAAIRALPALGYAGVNITVPHKVAVRQYLDDIEQSARSAGAVNMVTVLADGRLRGANTDVNGVLEPLSAQLSRKTLAGANVVVAGACGAARAACVALRMLGADFITVLNRGQGRALAMLDELGIPGAIQPLRSPLPFRADVLVNATVLGMASQPVLPFDAGIMANRGIVFDMVYAPLETALLADARARGLVAIDGLHMLVGQAARAFELFFGAPPPRTHDAELRALLGGA